MPFLVALFFIGLAGYDWYSSRSPHHRRHGGPPQMPGGPVAYVPPSPPHGHHGHHHGHYGVQATPEWLEQGMSPEYAQAVWQAYYFERDPRNLHAFGDRLHEMRLHHAGEALHRRAEAMHMRAAHEGGHHPH